MKLNNVQIERLARRLLDFLKKSNSMNFLVSDDRLQKRVIELLAKEFDRENELDKEVNRMLDQLEKSNPGEFERYKMFGMLKKRLAKEKGIVL